MKIRRVFTTLLIVVTLSGAWYVIRQRTAPTPTPGQNLFSVDGIKSILAAAGYDPQALEEQAQLTEAMAYPSAGNAVIRRDEFVNQLIAAYENDEDRAACSRAAYFAELARDKSRETGKSLEMVLWEYLRAHNDKSKDLVLQQSTFTGDPNQQNEVRWLVGDGKAIAIALQGVTTGSQDLTCAVSPTSTIALADQVLYAALEARNAQMQEWQLEKQQQEGLADASDEAK
jgi:hypothetical protein